MREDDSMSRSSTGISRSLLVAALLPGAGLLTGCGESGPGSAIADSGPVAEELEVLFEEVESGTVRFDISGAVTSLDGYSSVADFRAVGVKRNLFRPALGGGVSRSGTNADGPYALTFYTDVVHESDPDNQVQAWINLVLPDDAEAGSYYTINSFSDAEEDQVQAHVQGASGGWLFAQQVEGGLQLFELGESVSAAWQMEAADSQAESARRISTEGAVKNLAFTPQLEANYELEVNGESQHIQLRIAGNSGANYYTVLMGNGIYLDFPAGIGPGDYPIDRSRGDGVIAINFSQHSVETVDGALNLVERDGAFDAAIELEASGEDEIKLSGTIEALVLERN